MSGVSLEFLGAAETVTGSRTILTHLGKRWLVDCGLFQGPKELRELNWTEFPDVMGIEGIFLTHAHIDHSGFLPRLVRQGYRKAVYSSHGTRDLCDIMLADAAYLQEEDARFANKVEYSSHHPALPLYEMKDAEEAMKLFKPLSLDKWHEIAPDLKVRLISSGHILGSTYLQFQVGPQTILFSGDVGNGRSFVLRDPQPPPASDYVIIEGTYGDRVQPKVDPKAEMAEIITKVTQRGGTLVIPAFSVGRTQELLHIIGCLEKEGLIKPVPVYLDSPMALDATDLYHRYSDQLKVYDGFGPLKCSHYIPVQSADESMLLCMSEEPKVVISAAGMLTGGRIMHHLKARLKDEKSAVLFVGYQASGTKGQLLKQGLKKIRIHHQMIHVEAEIFSMEHLSAHADSDDLINWLAQMPKPKQVLVNHGEKSALEALAYRIRTELEIPATVVRQGQIIDWEHD